MSPFRKPPPEPDEARVRLYADIEGYLHLEIDGVMCGKVKPGGNLVISSEIPLVRQTEAALALVHLESGWPDEGLIAKKIMGFRRAIRRRRLFARNPPSAPEDQLQDLPERGRRFVASFFDLERVEEYAQCLDRLRRLALLGLLREEDLPSIKQSAIPEVVTSEDILIVHTVIVDATAPESKSCNHHLSMSRAGGLAPIHARFLFALASVRFELAAPEVIFRSRAGVWHTEWMGPRGTLGAAMAEAQLQKHVPLGDSFERALERAARISFGDVDIPTRETIPEEVVQ